MSTENRWDFDLESGAAPWGQNGYVVRDPDHDPRAQFFVRGDAARYARDRNCEAGIAEEVGDAHGETEDNMESRISELRSLQKIANGEDIPLAVQVTTTFEIVLGTGGPDDRFLIECDRTDTEQAWTPTSSRYDYEIRRVLYRYSWKMGSAERELHDEDKEIVEAFARRVVPELVE